MTTIRSSGVRPILKRAPTSFSKECQKCQQCYHQDLSGICQSFEIKDIDHISRLNIPTQTQLDQPLWVPIPSDAVISRSSSAVNLAGMANQTFEEEKVKDKRAPIERLPAELFDQIIPYLAINAPTNGYTTRNKDLASCLLVSRTFHYHTLATLFAHVTFPHSSIFSKFLSHIKKYPELGELVKRLDFSAFTSVGLGRTMRMNFEIQRLTATTLRNCLQLTPRLREFLASESMGMDTDAGVLQHLFCELPYLQALDFCGLSHKEFVNGMTAVLTPGNSMLPQNLPIKRLGLHGCTTVQMSSIATLLPRLSFITHLDLTHTQVTDAMLNTIPTTARLTHLSLSRCNRLKGPATVEFLINHPACRSLVYLNLLFETSRYRLLSTSDVDTLLPELPSSLVSLNLSGAKLTSAHIPELRRLAKHLEELSIGHADLSINDICTILEPGYGVGDEMPRHTLRYLDVSGISSVNPTALLYTQQCNLLLPTTYPLQVIELSEKVVQGLKERPVPSKKVGWKVKDTGRRGWYVRAEAGVHQGGQETADRCNAVDRKSVV